MAAPQVTGTIALLREEYPDATVQQLQRAIEAGADGAQGASDPDLGAGRLNSYGALTANVFH